MIPNQIASGAYQTRTSVRSSAGRLSTGSYWEKSTRRAALVQASSSRRPSTIAVCSIRGRVTAGPPRPGKVRERVSWVARVALRGSEASRARSTGRSGVGSSGDECTPKKTHVTRVRFLWDRRAQLAPSPQPTAHSQQPTAPDPEGTEGCGLTAVG